MYRHISRPIAAIGLALAIAPASLAARTSAPAPLQVQAGQTAQSDTLRLTDAVAATRAANPAVQASRLRAEAEQERVSPAGALPDPVLELGLVNRPLDGFGTDERMTMNVIGLKQAFPWPGNQGFSEEGREHAARAAQLDAAEVEAQVVARTRSVHAQLAYLDRAIAITAGTRELLRDFLVVAETRYASGSGLQQDILQAQVAVGRTTADIAAMEQQRIATAARLNALMGRPAERADPCRGSPGAGR